MKHNKEKNNFTLTEVIVITLAFCSLTGVLVGLFFYYKNDRNLIIDNEALDILDTYNKIVSSYYGEVSKEDLSKSAIDGMMDELDEQYTRYMDNEDTTDLNTKLDGTYKGVGIQVTKVDGNIIVHKVYNDTPASKAGLKENDIIIKVNDYEVQESDEMEKVSALIKEKDKTNLTIKRGDEVKDLTLEVKTIIYPSVDYKMFEANNKKIGYIYLSTFSKTSAMQVRDALNDLEGQGIDSLIFDVRSNTGGYLDATEDILNMFISSGKILFSLEDNNGKSNVYATTKERRTYDIAVLINQVSASASEILASSLKESYGAILVGNKTYGKGLVQQTSYLHNQTMIKYTTAKWYTPDGNYINGIGYKPGIEVSLTQEYAKNPSDETDSQLQKAIEILSK